MMRPPEPPEPEPSEPAPPDTDLWGRAIPAPSPRSRGTAARAPQPAAAAAALEPLGRALPARLRLGTSSWSFPGWRGLVYDGTPDEPRLARDGLAAYARHPLFRTVGVDKTYYRPAPREEYARLAAQVPDGFRFLVKAWRGLVDAGDPAGRGAWLDAPRAIADFIQPASEGLGAKAGPLLFQFPPMGLRTEAEVARFAARLGAFLRGLPRGPLYAVEVRDRALVGAALGETLADAGVAPCLTVHPTMPSVEEQSRALALDPSRPLVMRWMLRGNHRYGEAKDLYAPFDRLAEPDDDARDALARLARAALGAGLDAWIVVNNKAEGSSPLSVERLARAVTSPEVAQGDAELRRSDGAAAAS
jgi:uncharacterized protein YecE (DUF72 family)